MALPDRQVDVARDHEQREGACQREQGRRGAQDVDDVVLAQEVAALEEREPVEVGDAQHHDDDEQDQVDVVVRRNRPSRSRGRVRVRGPSAGDCVIGVTDS